METIISVITLVLNAFMDIPSRSVAGTERKKAEAAKSLARTLELLNQIIQRGHEILHLLETLFEVDSEQHFKQIGKQLAALYIYQSKTLNLLVRSFRVFSTELYFRPKLRKMAYISQIVRPILTVYSPDLEHSLWKIFNYKGQVLLINTELFENLSNKEGLVIREPILPNNLPEDVIEFEMTHDIKEKTKYREMNLGDPHERQKYLSRARERLAELKRVKNLLAVFIKENYEPHHII